MVVLPQMWGPNVQPDVKGRDDYRPIQWAGEPCGHKVMARVGDEPIAIFTDQFSTPISTYLNPEFIVVDALPGECPVCDNNPRMAVRDSPKEGN